MNAAAERRVARQSIGAQLAGDLDGWGDDRTAAGTGHAPARIRTGQAMTTYGEKLESGAPISAVFELVVDLHVALRAAPVQGRLWVYTWAHGGVHYSLEMNGDLSGPRNEVPPMHVAICREGWPLVLCDMFGGGAVGKDAEDLAIAALQAAIEQAANRPGQGPTAGNGGVAK